MTWNVNDSSTWGPGPVPMPVAKGCWRRLRKLRDRLREAWIIPEDPRWGFLTDWLLATLVARENVLLLGLPGTAKSEIATWTYRWLGLQKPAVQDGLRLMSDSDNPFEWWTLREAQERRVAKYFHYQLSRFTQLEELFGPVEITLLRKGVLVRVNFSMLTGAGVRAAFIDEVFKASGALLNSLLMLLNERSYFNWGGMLPSDLASVITASNEMPGSFSGLGAAGGQFEDFHTLYALLDRLVIRLEVPLASGSSREGAEPRRDEPGDSDLAQATRQAIERESLRFTTAALFQEPAGDSPDGAPSLNDVLLLGRAMMQDEVPQPVGESLFEKTSARVFREAFLSTGAALQQNGTNLASGHISWTISPRKMKALFKVARAHALLTADNSFGDEGAGEVVALSSHALWVFRHIWDSPLQREPLAVAVEADSKMNWEKAWRRR